MIERAYTKPNDIAQLADEIIAAIPSLAPVPDPSGRLALDGSVMQVPVFEAMASGDNITLNVPENTDLNALDTVVSNHVPKARQTAAQIYAQISGNAGPLKSNLVPIAQLLIGAPTPWPTQAQIQAVQAGTATNAQAQAVVAGLLRFVGHLMLVMSANGGLG